MHIMRYDGRHSYPTCNNILKSLLTTLEQYNSKRFYNFEIIWVESFMLEVGRGEDVQQAKLQRNAGLLCMKFNFTSL